MMQLAAKNNNSKFIDLSVIFKKEKNSSINFFDKAHLTGSGQKKVAEFLVKTIKNLSDQKSKYVDLFQSREEQIKNILEEDFSGQYKTVEDY